MEKFTLIFVFVAIIALIFSFKFIHKSPMKSVKEPKLELELEPEPELTLLEIPLQLNDPYNEPLRSQMQLITPYNKVKYSI
jgi:hypothetical protein